MMPTAFCSNKFHRLVTLSLKKFLTSVVAGPSGPNLTYKWKQLHVHFIQASLYSDRPSKGDSTVVYSQWGATLGVLNIDSRSHEDSWLQVKRGQGNRLITTYRPLSADELEQFEALDMAKATSPDNITAIVLKTCAPEHAAPLAKLFLKVMEGIISAIKQHLLSDKFGFCQGHSAPDLVTALVQTWTEELNSRGEVRIIAFDIKAAFDRVRHKGALAKLESMGIRGQILWWLVSYLTLRKMVVVVG
eukprot:g35339.t1